MKFETMFHKRFRCVGENFKDNVPIGFCGDVHTLEKWIEILFYDKYDEAIQYFEGDTLSSILNYILLIKGKRLIKE